MNGDRVGGWVCDWPRLTAMAAVLTVRAPPASVCCVRTSDYFYLERAESGKEYKYGKIQHQDRPKIAGKLPRSDVCFEGDFFSSG